MGQRVHVLLDRIDRQQRRLQFALVPSAEVGETKSLRKSKAAKGDEASGGDGRHTSPDRSGKKRKTAASKKKARHREKKNKGKRK
jgi:ribonuclease R